MEKETTEIYTTEEYENILQEKFIDGAWESKFPDGDYKVYIDRKHVLTKKVKDGKGENYAGGFKLPFMSFHIEFSPDDRVIEFVYPNFIDRIRKVTKGYYVGYLKMSGEPIFWFELKLELKKEEGK